MLKTLNELTSTKHYALIHSAITRRRECQATTNAATVARSRRLRQEIDLRRKMRWWGARYINAYTLL